MSKIVTRLDYHKEKIEWKEFSKDLKYELIEYSWKGSVIFDIDRLVQERYNYFANALEFCLSCTNL